MPLTGELARIDDELRRAYDGECWHGPPLRAVLADTSPEAYEKLIDVASGAAQEAIDRAEFYNQITFQDRKGDLWVYRGPHSGADPANVNPTQFSGGSRVIYYGLMSRRQMQGMSIAFYAAGLGIGLCGREASRATLVHH